LLRVFVISVTDEVCSVCALVAKTKATVIERIRKCGAILISFSIMPPKKVLGIIIIYAARVMGE
jgi:hypothetical protein